MRIPRQAVALPSFVLAVAVFAAGVPLRTQAQSPPVVAAPPVLAPPRFPPPKPATLSPLADTITNFLVFAPVGTEWFTAVVRNKKLLLDVGRVDTEVRRDSARAGAYREAVEGRSTVPLGSIIRVRGPWGAEDATASAVEVWNGRIALRLTGTPALDSLVRASPTLVVSAQRVAAASPALADSCDRGAPLAPEMAARLLVIRESVEKALRAGAPPADHRLRRAISAAKSTQVQGCFGGARRVALMVSLRAGDNEWTRERIVLVDTLGRPASVRVNDFRFRSHDLLAAFDADGDGIDDFVTRATTKGAGGTSILTLDFKARRANRLSTGFVWEEM